MQDVISKERGSQLASDIGALGYYETSAKTGTEVTEVFEEAARLALRNKTAGKKSTCSKCILM